MTGEAADLEFAAPGDPARDYCLWDYRPPAPAAGKLRSASLLWHAFRTAGADPRLAAMSRTLRTGLGPFRTVWGVKRIGDAFSWEYYFYDYARLARQVSVARVLAILAPHARSPLTDPSLRPYFMFSLDLDDALACGARAIDALNLYVGNPGSTVSSGIAYTMTADAMRLDNFYFFFDAARERQAICAKVATSAHLDLPSLDLDEILWPSLARCGTIVVANKTLNDGVYFSRISIGQFIAFLERLDYPEATRRFVTDNRARLDHLLFDVGIDYAVIDGRICVVKSAYYGIL
ncbi:hypothetical protein MKK55_05305 [Methylobacterium sp. J-059]|uniref:hypothetical protein n=1 Tax=Methylobacterium sp. J-059 TaxID=2836643 RepID=UPI001FBAD543|nr:hypothetical protein [Methylobacterium sp. J-059]MCJ2038376.1 hypothetical protein [Methylobacterium sp. J-059]